jgi:hypothetical protein
MSTARIEPARVTLPSRLRWAGGLASAAALGALIAIGPPGPAVGAAGPGFNQVTGAGPTPGAGSPGFNQMTGAGLTDSAVTVHWTQGLLDTNNRPIASANADRGSASPASPYSFMYPDFKNLSVSVSQTKDITHQGITVSWKGGEPTIANAGVQGNFLQLMECYGDSSSGPDPNACEYGTPGLLGPEITNKTIGQREGDICAAGLPSVTSPPGSLDGSSPLVGCDPQEPVAGANPPHVTPCSGTCATPTQFSIPFVPASNPGSPVYQADLSQYFDQFNTNEVQEAVTDPAGTGQLQFETLTGTQSSGLGCGEKESNGQPRGCWLVIVPRGLHEPNGFKINTTAVFASSYLYSSPLSASNWAQRIQIHLDYAPVQNFCPIGTQERETVGTQTVARVVQSWQLALNQAANCTKIYGYTAVPEATSTQELSTPGSGIGLAFTTIPIGSEAVRDGGHTPRGLPPVLYAPVAVTAVGFGFNINDGTGFVSTPVKLSPELLAKGLTQVYRFDLPDFYTGTEEALPNSGPHLGPQWSRSNPVNLSDDPEFQKLNPEVRPFNSSSVSLAPLLAQDHSAANQQIWQWLQADPATSAWLERGTKDAANSVTADPDYQALKLGRAPAADSFPRAYAACLDLGKFAGPPPKEIKRCSLDLLPYTNSYDTAGSSVLTAVNPTLGGWDPSARAPDNTFGWFDKNGTQPLGQIFLWGISDTPDLAAYGLVDAQLCNDAGTACVAPSIASVATALNSATRDGAGLLQVNPARPGKGGYPLVQVTYAAVPTNQSAAALNDYANLIAYAAGQGQTPGVAPGDLPPGYLPLPATLRKQAQAVVAKLRADAGPVPSPSHSHHPTPPPTTSGSPTRSGSPTPSHAANPSGAPGQPGSSSSAGSAGQPNPTPGASPPGGPVISPPSAVLAGTKTPSQQVGGIRWVLIAVVLAGAACAALGGMLRYARVPRWLHRMRP